MTISNQKRQVVLIILDGWGLSPSWGGNALTMNNPKNLDRLWQTYPHAILQALGAITSGGAICDSRLGHTLIGTGRIVESNYSRINRDISTRQFFRNEVLLGAIEWAKRNDSNLHLMGCFSTGGVHAHLDHVIALLNLAHEQNFDRVYIDAITDGIDTGPVDALLYVEQIQNKIKELGMGRFSSVGGRYWAMNRDEHWDRTLEYYKALLGLNNITYQSIQQAITSNYQQGLNDQNLKPGLIQQEDGKVVPIRSNDSVIFYNFREDRARQLSQIFIDPRFKHFPWMPAKLDDIYFATFINYQKDLPAKIVFPDTIYPHTLTETLSQYNLRQLKVAETEKQAHVTYFFNGGTDEIVPGEERKIVSSPEISTYEKMPAMSAQKTTSIVVDAVKSKKYDFILINYANVDALAHTGNILAVGQAVQILDKLVNNIVQANLKVGGVTMITADHGNAEQMLNLRPENQYDPKTFHTLNPVPFFFIAPGYEKNLVQSAISAHPRTLAKILQSQNTLADVAPTVLQILGLPKPVEMTGHSLLNQME